MGIQPLTPPTTQNREYKLESTIDIYHSTNMRTTSIVLCIGALSVMVSTVDIKTISATFDKLLAMKVPTQGTPFKKIKGPRNLDDKIAIVGSGPAGVHMAYLLQKAGFTDIHLLEKSKFHVGGKSTTIKHRGIPNDIATYALTPDYKLIHNLIDEFDVTKQVPSTGATIWPDDKCNNSLPLQTWLIGASIRSGEATNVSDATTKLYRAAFKYILIFKKLFGSFEGELMPRPSEETLHAIRGTILDFLKRNNIEILRHLFIQMQTTNGYGYPDEVSALYGFLWSTPVLLDTFLNPLPGRQKIDLLDKGWQPLWQAMVDRMVKDNKLTIKYNRDVYKIRRRRKSVKIYTRGRRWPEHYDFLILTPSMKNMINTLYPRMRKEHAIFPRLNPVYYVASMYDISSGARGLTPFDFYYDNILKKKEFHVTFDRNNYAGIMQQSGLTYKNGETSTGPVNDGLETRVALQLGSKPPNPEDARKILLDDLDNCKKDVNIVTQRIWSYFPHFSTADVTSGKVWDIYDMQGRYNTWYAGSSVIFESAKSVVEYNKLLMDHFEVPKPKCKSGWWWRRCRKGRSWFNRFNRHNYDTE